MGQVLSPLIELLGPLPCNKFPAPQFANELLRCVQGQLFFCNGAFFLTAGSFVAVAV